MAETQRIVGIDLGTTNSLVATMHGDTPAVIPGDDGSPIGPFIHRAFLQAEHTAHPLNRSRCIFLAQTRYKHRTCHRLSPGQNHRPFHRICADEFSGRTLLLPESFFTASI